MPKVSGSKKKKRHKPSECQKMTNLLTKSIRHVAQLQESQLLFLELFSLVLTHTHVRRIFCQFLLIQV